jgi:hypothetical protein
VPSKCEPGDDKTNSGARSRLWYRSTYPLALLELIIICKQFVGRETNALSELANDRGQAS